MVVGGGRERHAFRPPHLPAKINVSLHVENDRRTPSIWHRHELIWTAEHCALLAIASESSLEECKAACLSDEQCTAFNFFWARRHGCERRHCAQGERPTERKHGWIGFSSFSARDAKLTPPEELTNLPTALTAVLLLVVAAVSVVVAIQRAFPDLVFRLFPRLTSRPLPRDDESASASHARSHWRLTSPWEQRGTRVQAATALELELATMSTPAALALEEDEPWTPVLTDPLACNSQHFSCGPG